jgi:hypothetical protein
MSILRKKCLLPIANNTIKINNKKVSSYKIFFGANNNLIFRIKDLTNQNCHNIEIPLYRFIYDSINDKNKELKLETSSGESTDIPLKSHFLTKYNNRNNIKKMRVPISPEDPRIITF